MVVKAYTHTWPTEVKKKTVKIILNRGVTCEPNGDRRICDAVIPQEIVDGVKYLTDERYVLVLKPPVEIDCRIYYLQPADEASIIIRHPFYWRNGQDYTFFPAKAVEAIEIEEHTFTLVKFEHALATDNILESSGR